MEVYVVLSRDSFNYIFVTDNIEKAEIAKNEREKFEERSGGKPYIYIKTTTIK